MNKKRLYNYCLPLFLLFIYTGNAQNYNELSNNEKLKLRLQSHILIDPNAVPLSSLQGIIQKKIPIALYLSEGKGIPPSFLNEYVKFYDRLILISEDAIENHFEKKIGVITVNPKDIENLKLTSLQLSEGIPILFKGLEELGSVYFKNNEYLADSLFLNLWKQSGKLPNFIYTDSSSLEKVKGIVTKINTKKKVFGIVRSEEGLLQNVIFKDFNKEKVNGYFSFPISDSLNLPILIPHKAGYHFSPDIIFTTPDNENNLKDFMGFPLNPEFGLSYHFMFDTSIRNKIEKKDEEFISNNVLIKQDSLYGTVGFFKERAYIDVGIESRSALKSSFTITALIKPTTLDYNNSILGKGDNFVLKIHDGFLTFTMAGIKDYISKSSPIPINKWTHISLVHSKTNNDLLFYINGEQTDKVELIADYVTSDYNLLIGNNLWEEFFIGYLKDIKIWERELNNKEIKFQYHQISGKDSTMFSEKFVLSAAISLLVVIFISFLVWYKKKAKKLNKPYHTFPTPIPAPYTNEPTLKRSKERILCFGTLKIINKEGINIAEKLSPKLKSLFIIIFLHSQEGKKGISTKKLTELLWPGMSLKNAKNTRGTNIQNLRLILSSCSEIKLVFQDKNWILEISNTCYSDYNVYLNYLNFFSKSNYSLSNLERKLPKLLAILKEGRLLTNTNDSWLDTFIEKISNQIIEQCLRYVEELDIQKHSDLLYDIAEVIYIYDDLNERALQLKIQILIKQGKLSLAHTVHDNFVKLYQKIYKENYAYSFEDMVSEYNF